MRLSNHFVPGRTRRYRVTSTTSTTTGRQRADNPVLDESLKDQPVPPVERSTITFDEEEHCSRISDEQLAEISYRCLGFRVEERIGDASVLELDVRRPADLIKVRQVPKYIGLAALMEAPITFTIDASHVVHQVTLPGKLAAPQETLLREDYRRNLQSRYQAFFPEAGVRPGSSWSRELTTGSAFWGSAAGVPDSQLDCKVVFARIEEFQGRRCAVLEVEMSLPPGEERVLHRTTITRLVADELSGRSTIRFDIDSGTPIDETTRTVFRLRRILGTVKSEPIETPITLEQTITASWQGTTDAQKPAGR